MIPGRGSRLPGGGFPANGKRKVNILVSLELIIFTTDYSGIEKGIIIRIFADCQLFRLYNQATSQKGLDETS